MDDDHYRVGYLLHRADHALGAALDAAVRPLGITAVQATVLLHVDRFPATTGAGLSRLTSVTPQTMHRIVVGLERRGLVRRVPAPGDRKSVSVSLTAQGTTVLRQAETVLRRVQDVLLDTYSPAEVELLHGLLQRFEQAFSPTPEGPA